MNKTSQIVRGLATIVSCGALAVISSMAAFALSFGRVAPEAALDVWPQNGNVLASVSSRKIARAALAERQDVPATIPQDAVSLARQALVLEPTSVSAIRNIAYDMEGKGQTDRARALMLTASTLSRRNTAVNLWLMQDFAQRGRDVEALRYYDVTMRSSSTAANALLPIMAQVLKAPGSAASFELLLVDNPPWHDDFWTTVLSTDDDLVNSVDLRGRLHRAKVPLAASHDALLIRRLVEKGRLRDAFDLYETAGGKAPAASGELIRNGSFDQTSRFPPIDWKVVTDGAFGAMIDPNSGQLSISSLPKVGGVVAQQLVGTKSGEYWLDVEYAASSSAQKQPLLLRVACAEMSGESTLNRVFQIEETGRQSVRIRTPCSFAWLSIELDASNNVVGVDASLNRISLRGDSR